MAESAGCPAFDSHGKLFETAKPDAILVCTPPSTHPAICTEFLERGVPVLCEKPLSTDPKSTRAMVKLAERKGVVFTMATKFRFVEDVIRAKSIVSSGILGDVVLFENAFTARVDMSGRWNSDPAISGGGVIVDNGTHSIDIVRYFLGPIEEVFAVEGKRVQCVEVEDTARIFVRSVHGVLATIDLSWSIDKQNESYVDLYGSHGVVRVGWRESRYRQLSSSDWVRFGTGYDKVQAMGGVVRNFVKGVRGEEPILVTGEDMIASAEVIDSIYSALGRDVWNPVRNGQGSDRRQRERAPAGV